MEKNVRLEGFSVSAAYSIEELPDTKKIVNTLNAYSWLLSDSNRLFKDALLCSDVILPDGISIVIAAKLLSGEKIKKVAGADLHEMLLKILNRKKGTCFYLGSSDCTLHKIAQKIKKEFPNIEVGFYSPPFKSEFSIEDNDKMVAAINDFAPDVVFVGMTAPKQEIWIYKNKEQIKHAKIICGIGAVFDFYAETKKRPPQWLVNLGLEWLGRLIAEPRRLWKRYVVYNMCFFVKLVKLVCKGKRKNGF
ncbi:MAG: WecB/TagA/CpsF family glycosyltransferase [Massilibacteroides sp.]|nr:WecB/TagA/CpsF family glycosyltransferase [Massilibacteroides sp.]MDD3062599.1 WecB/TagA/CpsF family glycosyltransferase [Massilibacteroides sp.]MDD4116189.1 WecB/TagA/CpsF family glycosyltransferase [Massilibacteroides sp.]MDD4660134.1 WecB/TagA/CpsF family glycosyltransferase [Massilibacteroides sp.]